MRRRTLVALIHGAAARPQAAHAQRAEHVRRLGVLLPVNVGDTEYPALLDAFLRRLRDLGWSEERDLNIDVRWSGANPDAVRRHAAELVSLAPDVILCAGGASAGPLLRATRSIPVVFTVVPDPVGASFVQSLARPNGNATGFTSFGYDLGAKWLELLKEIAPQVARVGVLRDPAIAVGVGQWDAVRAAAPALGLAASTIDLRAGHEPVRDVAEFARAPGGGLVVTSSALAVRHRDAIVRLAAEHRLPALYYAAAFVGRGGLMSYGPDRVDLFRRAAGYVDRILRGERPADLPVQEPTRYELAINLRTAQALGLGVPVTLMARADELIE